KREPRQMEAAVRRLSGHRSAGPSGVCAKSKERIRLPIPPPPLRKPGSCIPLIVAYFGSDDELLGDAAPLGAAALAWISTAPPAGSGPETSPLVPSIGPACNCAGSAVPAGRTPTTRPAAASGSS